VGKDRDSGTEVTRLLQQAGTGDASASARLLDHVYADLRRQAGARMRSERSGHTLQPTALVHEAYLRLVGDDVQWENRAHFFGAAAEAMRRILIEHARGKAAQKRGALAAHVTFDELRVAAEESNLDVLALDQAIDALAKSDERLARVVTLRYFAGLSVKQTAEVLNTSPATVKRDWTYARAWLYDFMTENGDSNRIAGRQ
jgi:RNA polymerase sigma factor (TIGR02999 family)